MTETTVAGRLPYGSVEQYATILRREPGRAEYLDLRALAIVKMIVLDYALSDALRIERIKNVVAAADLVGQDAAPDPTGQAWTRNDSAEDMTLTQPGPRTEPHTGAMTDGGLVDETEERCPDCGESLREIRLGTLGHIPGEPCDPDYVRALTELKRRPIPPTDPDDLPMQGGAR